MDNHDNNQVDPIKETGTGDPTRSFPDNPLDIDKEIGPYKLLSILGEGAFGIVYRAEQKRPVRRHVALKVLKPGMDSKQVLYRFEAERQALAILDHPNIARVFDAGTTDFGRPYFVMEYVKGIPITEYCDRHKLNVEERLQLTIQVCEAIQHAHQKGIIHRDIKPSNILVAKQDETAITKVIDFGVAKAIHQPLTERTLFTQQGQLIGTPEYMSPEQAELTTEDIDTRSDVYSLGVLLYELLTGTLPFEPEVIRKVAFDEILRLIRTEEPPSPSNRLLGLGEYATEVAASMRTDIKTLANRLSRELEWIPLKAMRKERDRRYRTVSDLSEDIRNYLDGNPLTAGPESWLYRLSKFVKKQKGLASAVISIAIILIVSLVIMTSMFFKSEKLRTDIENTLAEKEATETARLQQVKLRQLAEEKTRKIAKTASSEAQRAIEKELLYNFELYANQNALILKTVDDYIASHNVSIDHIHISKESIFVSGDTSSRSETQAFLDAIEKRDFQVLVSPPTNKDGRDHFNAIVKFQDHISIEESNYTDLIHHIASMCGIAQANCELRIKGVYKKPGQQRRQNAFVIVKGISREQFSTFCSILLLRWEGMKYENIKLSKSDRKLSGDIWDVEIEINFPELTSE